MVARATKGHGCMNETLGLFYVMFDRKLLDTANTVTDYRCLKLANF